MTNEFNLQGAFLALQQHLEASYGGIRAATGHPGLKGDDGEANWRAMLADFLPRRYDVGPVVAVDADGHASDQIDLAVYDQQYSPQWFGSSGCTSFVPVESIYAVFEVKPDLGSANMRYAAEKVASVRRLRRTSAPIKHAGGRFDAVNPVEKHIIGGILTTRSGWADRPATIRKIEQHLKPLGDLGALDLGIALDYVSFDRTPNPAPGDGAEIETQAPLTYSNEGQQLVHLAIRLFSQLQLLGTVLAVDMTEYEASLSV